MAFSKKVSRRRYRSSRYRRRAWRRRYRRNRYRRRYRRARKYRPEYKRLEFSNDFVFQSSYISHNATTYYHVTPNFYDFCVIGASNPDGWPAKCFNISSGSSLNQRIGAKIRPVSLRLFGTMSICKESQQDLAETLENVNNVNNCMLRMIVFQIRNGNNDHNAMDLNFSAVNPYVVRFRNIEGVNYPVVQYNGVVTDNYNSVGWFSRLFSVNDLYTTEDQVNNNSSNVFQGMTADDRLKFGTYAKSPYRNGVGTYLKVLKDKLYYLNPTTAPSFAFRTKVRRPYRMVWIESTENDNELEPDCKNPIFICFIPIFPLGINASKITVSLHGQFYYTDK